MQWRPCEAPPPARTWGRDKSSSQAHAGCAGNDVGAPTFRSATRWAWAWVAASVCTDSMARLRSDTSDCALDCLEAGSIIDDQADTTRHRTCEQARGTRVQPSAAVERRRAYHESSDASMASMPSGRRSRPIALDTCTTRSRWFRRASTRPAYLHAMIRSSSARTPAMSNRL